MKILSLILVLTCFNVYSQTEYRIPLKKDTASIASFQYDFKPIEKSISKIEKAELLQEMIIQLDTSSCYYFTGFDSYSEFILNLDNFANLLPYELERNIHLVSLNSDNEYDFIYDRLNFGWDFQSIYLMIKQRDGWNIQKIPGFIIVNIVMEDEKIIEYNTYKWACCDFPYDYYYVIEQNKDSTILKSQTAFSRYTEFPEKIAVIETKKIEMKTDSLNVYASYKGKKEVYNLNRKVEGNFISETKIGDQEFVFVRLNVDNSKGKNQPFDFFMGWVKKKNINYMW